MNANQTIIDVTPIAHSSSRASSASQSRPQSRASSSAKHAAADTRPRTDFRPYGTSFGYQWPNPDQVRYATQTVTAKSASSVFGSFLQIGAGAGLVLLGIPMLILPGPGLLSIGAGMMLAANGARKLLS